jgi:hypothetical protein
MKEMSEKRMMSVCMVCIVAMSIFSGMEMPEVEGINGSFGGGDGTSGNPYIIEDVWDLQNMSGKLGAHYVLKNDIDASATAGWNDGAGFAPVGNLTKQFTGGLDGKNYTITGLFINYSTTDYVGIFGYIGPGGSVNNVVVVNDNVTGQSYVGGIVGYIDHGTVNNSHATGNVTGLYSGVGGLVGYAYSGTVNHSYTAGSVNGFDPSLALGQGGLVGANDNGVVNNSYSRCNVNGALNVGGLVGYNLDAGIVDNSYATGKVIGTNGWVGGLVGHDFISTVSNSYATGDVYGNRKYVGGLVGIHNGWTLNNSYATGNVTGYGEYVECVGGLVGKGGGINNSYATGNVTGNNIVGGLMGHNNAWVTRSYSTGIVNSTGDWIGGLVGHNDGGMVNNTYATGAVTGSDYVGGLVGYNYASNYGDSVSYSYTAGNVTGNNYTGGLIGNGTYVNTVSCCFWDKETTGRSSSAGGTAKTTAEMKTRSTFTSAGWDFTDLWWMAENVTYPLFIWQDTEPPTANAGNDQTVDEDSLATFNGSKSSDNFGIVHYEWKFIDGSPVTLFGVRPTYQFNAPGQFPVTLNVTDIAGNWDTDTMTVTVSDITAPYADAGPNQTINEGTLVTFDGGGSSDNAGSVNYTWTFTDGSAMTLYEVRPTYLFDNPGVFFVTLNVTDAAGNWGTDTMTVKVNDITAPVADAGPDQAINQGTLLTFNGNGSSDNVGIINFTWTFMDDSPVILYGAKPTHPFDNPGVFVVMLKVTDAAGNRGTDTVTVKVNDILAPVANAGLDQTIDEDTLWTFNANGSSDNAGIVNYAWTFLDIAPVTLYGGKPTYLFDNPGVFIVTLNVTDAAGNWATDTMNVTVNDIMAPDADAGSNQTLDQGTEVMFNASGSSDNVGIVNYTWTLMAGAPFALYGVHPTYRFDNPGVFVVTLNVSDASGNWCTDTIQITVNDITPPVADAGQDQRVPMGSTVALNGSLSTDNAGIGKYSWNFTYDGKTKSLERKTVSFVFDKGGVYEIVLTVNDLSGNSDDDNVVITVVDTGRVTGTVLDGNKKPVEGATVEITASNGITRTTKTAANGTFSVDIYHGPFTWNISKGGYRKISGDSSVNPMDEDQLDLSDHPLKKQDNEGPYSLPLMAAFVIILVVAAATGIGGYAFLRKRRSRES